MSEALQQRIIAHMNKEHQLALEDYLVIYGNVPVTRKIRSIRMKRIEKDYMVIEFDHTDVDFEVEKTIIFEPALEDWSEARDRLVTMAKEAAARRGLSHKQIAQFSPPSLAGWLLIAVVYTPILCYYKKNWFSWISLPESLQFLFWDSTLLSIIVAVLACHSLECLFLLRGRLNFYRVPTDYMVEWYISGLVEGYPAIKRFDDLINKANLQPGSAKTM
ncbi:uncharacterized protein Ecym_5589 [Eremothecium cymbalariae DBVPG|uniref:DUF2470 domain-containing protein n=1 Tax=Eremothecium cymbalariae (strain CBS 270.75 / DBVPG 7215 / KCTC 17166 / NRRL Y-17582) TaxID=931890 RepID=I6NE35_ERECY|nr:hypothetical protein Ecym_5589 [Eremothecium cymbalariae DBVPG\